MRPPLRAVKDHFRRRSGAYGLGVVLVVWAAGVALTAQGWRSRVPAFDLLNYIDSAYALIAAGTIPQHGDVGSYGSFKPAGTAWLMVPSTFLLDDPRLAEYVGTAFLHLATLVGLFLLARKYFGPWCGAFAVVLYGLSEIGLFLAGSLWPNGRPDFFVWIVYLASEWTTRRDSRFLAAAFALWGIGMQVDMALSPAFFVFPVVWVAYRPPVRVRPLLVAAALVLLVWAPYLRFEAPRNFADIRSQLLFDYIAPANSRDAWCDPTLTLRTVGDAAGSDRAAAGTQLDGPVTGAVDRTDAGSSGIAERIEDSLSDRLLSNFTAVASVRGVNVVLLLGVLAAMALASVPWRPRGPPDHASSGLGDRRRLSLTAGGALVIGLAVYGLGSLASDELQVGSLLRRLSELVVVGAAALLAAIWAAALAERLLTRAGVAHQSPEEAGRRRLLVLCLAVPWVLLFAAAEPGKPERFWWLWPLQALFLAALATYYLPRLKAGRVIPWLVQGLLVAVIVPNGFLLDRADAWSEDGWSGRDAPEVQVVDYLAQRLETESRDSTAVGYHVFLYPFMANYHIIDPQYKVGAEFDVLLRHRHGVTNTNVCAEGLSAEDEYRVVRRIPMEPDWAPRDYFDVPLEDDFRLLARFGPYRVFGRAR
jgi:hypothetical protein